MICRVSPSLPYRTDITEDSTTIEIHRQEDARATTMQLRNALAACLAATPGKGGVRRSTRGVEARLRHGVFSYHFSRCVTRMYASASFLPL